jgi:hypothetical protein
MVNQAIGLLSGTTPSPESNTWSQLNPSWVPGWITPARSISMTHICILPHCGTPTAGRSTKCNAHRLALRRHGHPLQVGIKTPEFEPYRTAIKRLWDANEGSPMWEVIRARWGCLLSHAEAVIAHSTTGVSYNRHEVKAAEDLLRLGRNVPFQRLACTALALYVFQADRPQRFKDDQAHRFQLVRKVRALDDLAVYKVWNNKRRTMHRVYRDVPPGTVRILADYLGAVFGEAGLLLRDHTKARPRLEATEAKVMAEAVRSLK